jgi:asparagine synthase (glutamine-hydrolysing)
MEGLKSMESRGPDDWGWALFSAFQLNCSESLRWTGKNTDYPAYASQANIFLGHRRLSIIDLSEAGHQPMSFEKGLYWIVYNGEVYNYLELREELRRLKYAFHTETDTEVILSAYNEWGEDCFLHFNGMWGMAIFDLQRQIILLSRDRFGVKPLYYCQNKNSFYFGSEIKAVLIASQKGRIACDSVVRNFLVHGLQPAEGQTFFQGIYQVPPGTTLTIPLPSSNKEMRQKKWWTVTPFKVDKKDAVQTWREIFSDAVRIRLRSDVPLGSCLSGGLDSSAIVGAMGVLLNKDGRRVHTITSCYEDQRCDERDYAESVVKYVDAIAAWVYPSRDHKLSDDIFHLSLVQEQPFPSLSIYSQYCVMRAAQNVGLTVLLDGQGGDELFLGYDACQAIKIINWLRKMHVIKAIREVFFLNKHSQDLPVGRLLSLLSYNGLPRLRAKRNRLRIANIVQPELISEEEVALYQETHPLKNTDEARKHWIEVNPLPSLLHYEDRNSMAFSIETRLPFLDYRLVNFALGLPEEWISHQGWSKYICRQGMKGLVPEEVRWRRNKKGFPAPTSSFLRDFLPVFKEIPTNQFRSEKYLNYSALLRSLHVPNPPEFLWRAVSLEIWMKAMNVKSS